MEDKLFKSPTRGEITLSTIAYEIVDYIKGNPDEDYQLIIGTDSEGNGRVEFVTAVIIYRYGKGGRYFYTRFFKDHITSLRQKIYEEVNASIITSQALLDYLNKCWRDNDICSHLEIHIDVGERGPTNQFIQGVVGMVLGCGFIPKTKPESYGASVVADKHI